MLTDTRGFSAKHFPYKVCYYTLQNLIVLRKLIIIMFHLFFEKDPQDLTSFNDLIRYESNLCRKCSQCCHGVWQLLSSKSAMPYGILGVGGMEVSVETDLVVK